MGSIGRGCTAPSMWSMPRSRRRPQSTAVHGVQTNAWSHGKISSWAHVYQHGPSEFPGTDYNDVLRVPHGTWLQTMTPEADDMTPEQEAKLDAVLSAVTTRDADGAYRQIKDFRDDNTHPNTVPGIKKSLSDTSAAVLTAVATLAAKVTDLADAVAQIQTASGGGPATITLTGTSIPSAP